MRKPRDKTLNTGLPNLAPSSLVSAEWLARHVPGASSLANPAPPASPDRLVVLDASHHLPGAARDARAEFAAGHIPGARFLDLASLTDASSPVPAAMPNAAQLAQRLAQLGIARDDRIILYDDSAVKTAARAWFILIAHGVTNVAILDGGLAMWRGQGHKLAAGAPEYAPAQSALSPATLPAAVRVARKRDVLAGLGNGVDQVIDARAAARVFGRGIDPVHGGQNGRIPGALNLPYDAVFAPDGRYKSAEQLRAAFAAAKLDLARPITASCGSGITASVLVFALHLIGCDHARLYDGSWQEWEADPDTPKAQGPQETTPQ